MQAIDPAVRHPGPDGYAHKLRVFGLGLAIVALPWSTGAVSVGVGLLVLGALFAPRGTVRDAVHPWVIRGCLALVAVFSLSALLSENVSRGLYEVKGLWPCLALIAGAATTRDSRRPWIFPALWLGTSAVAALYVHYQLNFDSKHWAPTRMLPTNVWRFNLSLAHGLACGVALTLQFRERRLRIALALTTLVVGSAFFSIGERMPVLTAALLLACAVPFIAAREFGARRVGIASVAAILIAGVVLSSNTQFQQSFAKGFDGFVEQEHKRLAMWSSAWSLFQEAPVLGVGIGDASDALQAEMVASHGIEDAPTWSAHSNFFHALAATGAVGAGVYLLWTLALIVPWVYRRKLATPAGFLCLWGWCQFATGGITDGTLFLSYFFTPFSLLYAVGAGIVATTTEKKPVPERPRGKSVPTRVTTGDFASKSPSKAPQPSPSPTPANAPAAMMGGEAPATHFSADAARHG